MLGIYFPDIVELTRKHKSNIFIKQKIKGSQSFLSTLQHSLFAVVNILKKMILFCFYSVETMVT
ncbi:hypothetical protein ES288_D06G182200v1, partial [Gossypium darwinii]